MTTAIQKANQRELIQWPTGDPRLLTPGWAGELAPDEFDYIQDQLFRDRKVAFAWGFRPGKKRRAEWAIRQVAMWGDPASRAANMELARSKLSE